MTIAIPPPKLAKSGKVGGLLKILGTGLAFVAGAAAGGFGAVVGMGRLGPAEKSAPVAAEVARSPVQYVELDNAFTSNLVDTGRYLQLRLSLSTTGGAPVVAAIVRHKPALISAVLSVLGDLGEPDVADRAVKDRLRVKLRTAINETLKQKGEAGSVDEVFFTSLVVQ